MIAAWSQCERLGVSRANEVLTDHMFELSEHGGINVEFPLKVLTYLTKRLGVSATEQQSPLGKQWTCN